MSTPPSNPSAATITVAETLGLLDTNYAAIARGVGEGRYAFWLGSGISRGRVPGLDRLVVQVLEFLRTRIDNTRNDCPHRKALEKALDIAELRDPEKAAIDFSAPASSWEPIDDLVKGLISRYAQFLEIEVATAPADYLLWEGVDPPATYGACTDPDTPHLAFAILVLEGVITQAPTPNWDGLIEHALEELSGNAASIVRVVVLPENLREPARQLTLLKFHGCAVLASVDPGKYRETLVARRSQIREWIRANEVEAVRESLVALATTERTIMVGLSAQDPNIQDVFSAAKARLKWGWPADPPAHVFAEDELGDDHSDILRVVYRDDYAGNEAAIAEEARIRAYAEQLLTALVLHVLAAKLVAYLAESNAPALDPNQRAELGGGLTALRDRAAEYAEPDRHAFIRKLVETQTRALTLFQAGTEPAHGSTLYKPLSNSTVDRIAIEPSLATSGLCELAAALALIGRGDGSDWRVQLSATAAGNEPVVNLMSSSGSEAAVFFAANGKAAVQIESMAVNGPNVAEVVIIHSSEPVETAVRSPSGRYGRTGDPGPRQVDMSALLESASDLGDLEIRFRQAAAL